MGVYACYTMMDALNVMTTTDPKPPLLQTYHVTIKDQRQPLLLSRPRLRDQRQGKDSVYLIPELCVATGLTDAMRSDFHMMKDLAQFTRMNPDRRVLTIRKFSTKLFGNEKVIQGEDKKI